MSDWDNLVEPARGALEALIRKGDEMADRIEELHNEWRFNANGWSDALARIEELEANGLANRVAILRLASNVANLEAERDALADRIEKLEAKLEKLERWQAAAFIAHGNLDLDIEANPEALAELKGL